MKKEENMDPKFTDEIKTLGKVYSEIVEAIVNKPDLHNLELSRIYFENVAAHMNNWAALINKTKVSLESRIPPQNLTADNRPA